MSNAPHHFGSRALGFTLLELVAVMVIVGILSAAVLPRLMDDPDFEQRGYIDEIASSLRYAQRIAIASGCDVSFTIDAAGYSASQRSSLDNCKSNSGSWTTQVQRADGSALSGAPPANVSLTPSATLVFKSDGALADPSPAFIVGSFTLNVDQHSGTVMVSP